MKVPSIVVIVLGAWLACAPGLLYYGTTHAVTVIVTGIVIAAAGLVALLIDVPRVPLWIALLAGIWTWFVPMMFGIAGPSPAADNDLDIGMLVVLFAGIALVRRPVPVGGRGRWRPWPWHNSLG